MSAADEEDDRTIRLLLQVIVDLGGSAPESAIRALLRPRMVEAGLVDHEGKIDRVYVGRDLLGYCERRDPPLVVRDFAAQDLDEMNRPLPGREWQYILTQEARMLLSS